jgi:WD40 repeat protein
LNWTNTDDRWFVTTSKDKSARIWDSRTGKLVCEVEGRHAEAVTSAVFSHDDTKLLTLSSDKYLILWDIRPSTNTATGITENGSNEPFPFHAVEICSIETRCFLELVISSATGSRMVAKGNQHFHVFNINMDSDNNQALQEALENTDS